LYSDLSDGARVALAQLPDKDGAAPGRSVVSPQTVAAMRAPAAQIFGRDIFGLGTMLFAKSGTDHVFGHDGNNFPAINHAIRIDPVTRSGIVILSSGSDEFPARLAADWVYWKTGNVDFFGFLSRLPHLLGTIGIGAAVIVVLVAGWVIWDARSQRRRMV
jgi:CubicO group peptidase (beta-lactamase class C family)